MIVFDLKCRKDHIFEAWFRDNVTFDEQVEAGVVACPVCGTKKVEKALMAPHVAKGGRELRRQVEENCDYVGPTFAEEARKIHYGESDERNIYGETSNEEAKALDDEGVKVQRIPWLPRENS